MHTRFSICFLGIFMLNACSDMPKTRRKADPVSKYKLAMVQMDVRGGDPVHNLAAASERIREAAGNGARIALLPEMTDFGWCHSSAKEEAGPVPGGDSFEALSRAARENNIYVCAGIAEKDDDSLYNTAVIIGPRGDLLAKHRKLNELDFAHGLYSQGDMLNVAHTELGTLGLLICADANADGLTLSKSLCYMGADIILSPCAWAVPPDMIMWPLLMATPGAMPTDP